MGIETITGAGAWVMRRAKYTLEKRGVSGTFVWALGQTYRIPMRYLSRRRGYQRELAFDRAHNVDTAGVISPMMLGASPDISEHAYAYQGCDWEGTQAAIRKLPIRHENFTFVDLGVGKGRVLMAVKDFNFRRLVGVEYSEKLCEIARRNNANLRAADSIYPAWKIICGDAGEYVPEGPTIVTLFNPFGPTIMRRVLDNISQTGNYVLYFNPTHGDMLNADRRFQSIHRDKDVAVYVAI